MEKLKNKVEVSIIVVTFNCENVISSCIKSITPFLKKGIELVVVDNNSSDNTQKILDDLKQDVCFSLTKNKRNTGYTKGCNIGIRKASGKYIFLLNPDTILIPENCPSLLSNLLREDHNIGAIAPTLLYPSGEIQNYTRRFPTVKGVIIESFVPSKYWNMFSSYRRYTYEDLDLTIDNKVEQPAGAAIMFENKYLLDETYFVYGSDVDICKSISSEGKQIMQTTKMKVIHLGSKGGTDSQSYKVKALLSADHFFAMQYFFKKNGRFFDFLCLRVLFIVGSIFSLVTASLISTELMRAKYLRLKLLILGDNMEKYVNT